MCIVCRNSFYVEADCYYENVLFTCCFSAPKTRFFSTLYPKPVTLSAGTSFTLPITFRPLERVQYDDSITFTTKVKTQNNGSLSYVDAQHLAICQGRERVCHCCDSLLDDILVLWGLVSLTKVIFLGLGTFDKILVLVQEVNYMILCMFFCFFCPWFLLCVRVCVFVHVCMVHAIMNVWVCSCLYFLYIVTYVCLCALSGWRVYGASASNIAQDNGQCAKHIGLPDVRCSWHCHSHL